MGIRVRDVFAVGVAACVLSACGGGSGGTPSLIGGVQQAVTPTANPILIATPTPVTTGQPNTPTTAPTGSETGNPTTSPQKPTGEPQKPSPTPTPVANNEMGTCKNKANWDAINPGDSREKVEKYLGKPDSFDVGIFSKKYSYRNCATAKHGTPVGGSVGFGERWVVDEKSPPYVFFD